MKLASAFALFIGIVSFSCNDSQAAQLTNAKTIEQQNNAGSLQRQIESIVSAANATEWIAYDVPSNEPGAQMCCFTSIAEGEKHQWRNGSCSLVEPNGGVNINNNGDAGARNERRDTFTIFLRTQNHQIDRVRMYSTDCSVDAGGLPVHHLSNVNAEESVTYLGQLINNITRTGRKKDERSHLIAAIAMHRASNSVSTLAGIARGNGDEDLRGHAAFWLGMKGGNAGRAVLRELVDSAPDDVQEQAVAGIAQDESREAIDMLLDLAKHHEDPSVRKRAIFWLGQKAGEKVSADLKEATNDPDEEVREMAVFAVSRLPKDEAIPQLINLARTNKSKEVREQAVFWLGQTGDPRALAFIEEIVTK